MRIETFFISEGTSLKYDEFVQALFSGRKFELIDFFFPNP
jgi:hypothetical protein